MPRQSLDYTLLPRKRGRYYYGKIRGWTSYRSTGKERKSDALREVQRWFEESRADSDLTFGQYASRFFGDDCPHCSRLADDGRPVSDFWRRVRRGQLDKYILSDPICSKPLRDLTRDDFLSLRGRIFSATKKVKKKDVPLSNSSKNQILGLGKTIIKEALFRELINRDITAGVKNLPEAHTVKALPTLAELHSLLEPGPHWIGEVHRLCFLMVAVTGMRRGEALALRWEHIWSGVITIASAYKEPSAAGNGATYGNPKWGINRKIPVPQVLADELEAWPRVGPFVLSRPEPPTPGWWMNAWNEATKRKGIARPGLTPHSLRHFANSWLLNKGFPPQHVRAYLGWSDDDERQSDKLTRVQRGYLHVPPEELQPLADAMSQMVRAGVEPAHRALR